MCLFINMTPSTVFVVLSCCFLAVGQNIRTTHNLRDAGSLSEMDLRELLRQNKITEQILQQYLERRLFPNLNRTTRVPTISEILPRTPVFFQKYGNKYNKSPLFGAQQQQQQQPKRIQSYNSNDKARYNSDYGQDEDDLGGDGGEDGTDYDDLGDNGDSLQSVESEHVSSFYSNNQKDCPNCVDENTTAPNRWTMPLLKLGEKRYYLGIFFKANWFRANQYCRYHGMHLASISSQEENDKLETYIRDFGLGNEHFWTSGTDLADEGHFFWMATGRPITFTNWNAGEPNNFRYENGEEENCLELWNRDGKGLGWNDSPCSFETYFVCEVQ
ncbi:uncharacterized protein LOC123299247 isoform X2 [Chrysoperla carnea]|uniref:uncharacterized protein LOC123299247 isoform X2 n=1 Tax=Chrysoperla carnea TaxID=189513 RepID=UPI001D089E19|nr:uncharacterized protein LOC123299247 isoform X2 [Chrysoperla carnea]